MQEDDAEVQEAVEIVTTAKLMIEVVTAAATQVVAASTPIPAAKPAVVDVYWNTAFDHVQAKDVQAKDVPAKGIQYIKRYRGFKKKPQSESEARKNMIAYLKNTEGFK
nr:hypothetical protein [Tanacetum cinerariifolium]